MEVHGLLDFGIGKDDKSDPAFGGSDVSRFRVTCDILGFCYVVPLLASIILIALRVARKGKFYNGFWDAVTPLLGVAFVCLLFFSHMQAHMCVLDVACMFLLSCCICI